MGQKVSVMRRAATEATTLASQYLIGLACVQPDAAAGALPSSAAVRARQPPTRRRYFFLFTYVVSAPLTRHTFNYWLLVACALELCQARELAAVESFTGSNKASGTSTL